MLAGGALPGHLLADPSAAWVAVAGLKKLPEIVPGQVGSGMELVGVMTGIFFRGEGLDMQEEVLRGWWAFREAR